MSATSAIAPEMKGFRAVGTDFICAPGSSADGVTHIVAGGLHVPNAGAGLAIGVKHPDGTSTIAVTPLRFARQIYDHLGEVIAQIERGDFDLPQVLQ
ncbi:hypothetical protein [Novosphingobium guangzhouense]|uniref:Uncharacterized protein n=1 Tax=Novosphingobium guangzhouense TaxID=1850347 RepID=A0A2K2G475_9SPHN|nr:hypothetical protein [Novosphingobium guangzhouense]PNU05827.1 hypothetical protein A8V01_14780 [Novosphingobium guangzhouense]